MAPRAEEPKKSEKKGGADSKNLKPKSSEKMKNKGKGRRNLKELTFFDQCSTVHFEKTLKFMQEQWVPGVGMETEIDTEDWDIENHPKLVDNRMNWSGSRLFKNPRSFHQLKLNAPD